MVFFCSVQQREKMVAIAKIVVKLIVYQAASQMKNDSRECSLQQRQHFQLFYTANSRGHAQLLQLNWYITPNQRRAR